MGLRLWALKSLRVIPKELLLSLWLLLGLGGGGELARKGLPAGSWHWQALPKTIFSKRIVVVVVAVVGLGVRGEACSKRPTRGELALASFAQDNFSKRIVVVVVVVVVGLGGFGAKLARKGLPAGSLHWQALPKTIFSKRIVVVVVVVVGLGGQALRCGGCWISSWTTSPSIAFQIHNGACFAWSVTVLAKHHLGEVASHTLASGFRKSRSSQTSKCGPLTEMSGEVRLF